MKRCPACNRVETDDALVFCRADGTRLVTDSLASDSSATLILPAAPRSAEVPTSLLQNKPSIAVLPFANMSADAENEYFCDGLAEELLNALAKIEDLKVAAHTSAFSFKGKNVNVDEIGRALHVNTVLEGSVRRAGNRLRITVQLVNAADGYHLWSERYDREMRDIFEVQDEITLAVIDALKVKLLGAEKAAVLKRYTDNAEAYQLYLRGRFFWNKRTPEGLKKAIEYFAQAIEIDPAYALAHAGLADSYALPGIAEYGIMPPREAMPKAKAAAVKALEIDDKLTEAQTTLAHVKAFYDWDWEGAEREFKRAIELGPAYAFAHHWYALYLAAMERHDEAIAAEKRAQDIDPLSLIINKNLGTILYYAGRYDQAIEQYRKALELDRDFARTHMYLGMSYVQKGAYEEAVAEYQEAINCSGASTVLQALIGHGRALSGNRGEALRILDELKEQREQKYVPFFNTAIIYVGLGETDQAFEWLEKAREERSSWLVSLKVEPLFNSLRSDPRYTDLLQRVGL